MGKNPNVRQNLVNLPPVPPNTAKLPTQNNVPTTSSTGNRNTLNQQKGPSDNVIVQTKGPDASNIVTNLTEAPQHPLGKWVTMPSKSKRKKLAKKRKKQLKLSQQSTVAVTNSSAPTNQFQKLSQQSTVAVTNSSAPTYQFQNLAQKMDDCEDFTDDVFPNMTSGGWKPVVESAPTSTKTNEENVQVTPTRKENWLKFQESLQKKLEQKAEANERVKIYFNSSTRANLISIIDSNEEQSKAGNEDAATSKPPVSISFRKQNTKAKQPKPPGKQTATPSNADNPAGNYNKIVNINQPVSQRKSQETVTKHVNAGDDTMNMSTHPLYLNAGKGVPRTFYQAQHSTGVLGAIQPQDSDMPNNPYTNYATNYVVPVQHNHSDIGRASNYGIPGQHNKVDVGLHAPVYVQTVPETEITVQQQYSPSDVYGDSFGMEAEVDNLSEPETEASGQKRVSAFERLGPLTQPKKPKLTINLLCNKDVREVVDEAREENKYTPVHLRQDFIDSKDDIVRKYLPAWPWKKNMPLMKTVKARESKSVMLLEREQMEEAYEKDHVFFMVTVTGYPVSWQKEDVLDVVLENVRGKSFIPSFTEFTPEACKFLVIRSRPALLVFHKLGFYMRKGDVELSVSVSQTHMSLNHIEFIPRLVLRKVLANGYDGERKLNLSAFTTKPDISHFLYFPLYRHTNQTELVQIQSTVAWNYLTDLNLSHNRISTIDGFEFQTNTPKLKHLDLSYNRLEKVTIMLHCRELSLHSIKLEGNPLCHDYTDPAHYVRVLRMIYPSLMEIDGMPIHFKGDCPPFKRNYCPENAIELVDKFLGVYFPLLDLSADDRKKIEDMYDKQAVLTVTYRSKLRSSALYCSFRNLFLRARIFEEGDMESVEGAPSIVKLYCKWPEFQHDPHSFAVDVMHHTDTSTVLRVCGILKITAASLAEDEHLLAFTRTFVLHTNNGVEYKILNEMLYWDTPTGQYANAAFQVNTSKSTLASLKLDVTPNDELKCNLIKIFMRITDLDQNSSEKCLEVKEWNIKNALEHFMKLVKMDDIQSLSAETS